MELLLLLAFAGFLLLWLRQRALEDRIARLERRLAAPEQEPPEPEAPAVESNVLPSAAAVESSAFAADLPAGIEEAEARRPTLAILFERFVGGRLLIWVGGIALAVAGVLLVRFSSGLITPPMRIGLAVLLGLALIAGGEAARRRSDGALDPRVGQALTGAGILILYAAPYGALTLYHLIPTLTASAAMAAVTVAALLLSLRHGAPAAVMGLAGGFATPLLVGDPNAGAIPLLVYLGLLDLALFTLAARRGWIWLAAAAILASFLWQGPFLFGAPGDARAAGVFILALGIAASLARAGQRWQIGFIRPAAISTLQLAILVGRADLGLPAWGLFFCLGAASFPIAARRGEYRLIPALALAFALVLIAAAPPADPRDLLLVAGATTLLFAGGSLVFLIRRDEPLLWSLIGILSAATPAILARIERPALFNAAEWGLAFLLLAGLALLFAARGRRGPGQRNDARHLVSGAGVCLLAALTAWEWLPPDCVGAAWAGLALAPAYAGRKGRIGDLALLALLVAAAGIIWSFASLPDLWSALALSLAGLPPLAAQMPPLGRALVLLALPALPIAALVPAMPRRLKRAPVAAAALLVLLTLYVGFKQGFGLRSIDDFSARGFGC